MSLSNRNKTALEKSKLTITPIYIGNETWYKYECLKKCKHYPKKCKGFIKLKTDKKPENADDIIQCFNNQNKIEEWIRYDKTK